MASIQTGIELNDQFSSVIYGIINSVNIAVSSMAEMQQTMNADLDTGSIDAARQELTNAALAADELNQALQNISPSQVQPSTQSSAVAPAQQNVQWQSDGGPAVFDTSGLERWKQEIQSADQMLERLNQSQAYIAQTASHTDVFSQSAVQDIGSINQRIQAIQTKMQQMESNPLNIGSDTASAEVEQLRSQLNQALQAQEQLNRAVEDMDVSAANAAYNRLSQTIGNTERYIRDNEVEQEKFTQTVGQTQTQSNRLMNTIKGTVAAYAGFQGIKTAADISDGLVSTTARLDTMNDGLQSTDELLKTTYAAAQDARGSFSGMADLVARFGNNAEDAFGSSDEVVQFANLIQKQMTIAGASTEEAANAELQLSQALGSGVLRGDELNSIFEQAPNLIQSIADYMGVPIGKIREMASEGKLSSDIVKNAIFASQDDINAKFDAMPKTWEQNLTSFKNTAIMAFQPVLQQINDLANNEGFQTFVTNAANALGIVAGVVLDIFSTIGSVAGFVSDNWGVIAPVIGAVVAAWVAYNGVLAAYNTIQAVSNTLAGISAARSAIKTGVSLGEAAATATAAGAQSGLNAALLACPLTWIILLIIALIAVVIAVANHIAKMGGTATTAFGVICGGVNVVLQFFKNLGLSIANIALGIGNAISALGSNVVTAFHNAICSVQSFWYNLLSTVLSVIDGICSALNKLPFVDFDYSGISQAADDYAAKSAEASSNKKEYKSIGDAFDKGNSTFDTFQKGWVSDAYASGAKWGDGVSEKLKKSIAGKATKLPDTSKYTKSLNNTTKSTAASDAAQQTAQNTGKTADSANKIAKSVDITSEDLKYLRDIAERDVVNRYTTASINIKQTNHNNVKNKLDLDRVTEHLRATVEEQMTAAARGVY